MLTSQRQAVRQAVLTWLRAETLHGAQHPDTTAAVEVLFQTAQSGWRRGVRRYVLPTDKRCGTWQELLSDSRAWFRTSRAGTCP